MNRAFAIALLAIASVLLNAAPAQVKAAKSSQTKPSKSSPSKAGTTHRRVNARYSRRAAPRPTYQLHPDPERYQQIQQALADRGYFKGQVNGQWGDDSVDALKRFQADQKLENDGKINALTLTDLGLGPRHDGGSVTPAMPVSSDSAATPHAGSVESPAPPPPPASNTPPR
ncbi:MAG TPA: peptidoglycan-binding domain-containing protein [Bryobacteraceae bacterium]|nr:peptidoglycan-binding domain-containing protein [Bryobacteraceae bacterium]